MPERGQGETQACRDIALRCRYPPEMTRVALLDLRAKEYTE